MIEVKQVTVFGFKYNYLALHYGKIQVLNISMIGDACARRLRFGFTRVTDMRMNVLYITLLGSDAQGYRGSFCKIYVIKMI